MGTVDTSPEAIQQVLEYAAETGMEPLHVKKEQPGYVLNSLLVPLLHAGAGPFVNEVADIETIDRAWRLGTGAPAGPFQIYDVIGLTTAYNVASISDDADIRTFAERVKTDYLDAGKLGVASGEGFYRYGG